MDNLTDSALRELDEISARGETPQLVSNFYLEERMQKNYFNTVRESLDPRFSEYDSEESFDENIKFIG